MPKKAFALQTNHVKGALSQLKWKLESLAELKRTGKTVSDPQVMQLDTENVGLLTTAKGGMRTVIDTLESLKKKCNA